MVDLAAHAVPGGPPQRLQRLPSWLINQISVVSNRRVTARFGRPGVRTDYGVLATLAEFGPLSQAQIGRRLGIDRSDIVALLNRLEGDEFVVREPDPSDRRRNAVRLTTAGQRHLHRLDTQVDRAQDELLEPLDATERATLIDLLQRVVDHHHESPDRLPDRPVR